MYISYIVLMYCDGRVLINRMAIFHKYDAFEHCMVWLYGSLFLHKSIFGVCSFGGIVFFTHAFCRWMTSYKLHLTDTIERMNKGQNIQGRMRGGGKSRGTPPPSNRSILKKPSIVSQACICKKNDFMKTKHKLKYRVCVVSLWKLFYHITWNILTFSL